MVVLNRVKRWLFVPASFVANLRYRRRKQHPLIAESDPAFNPQAEVNTITLVLGQMANDPAHSGWQFMRSLYDQFGYLPLATFEVWRALVQHPQALAMSLFKFEMSAEYLSRIENEFPILWEFFPIFEIKAASERFKLFLSQKVHRRKPRNYWLLICFNGWGSCSRHMPMKLRNG